MIIISTKNSFDLALSVSKSMGASVVMTEVKRFPDGELYVRIAENVAWEKVMLIGNTREDAEALEFLLLLNAAKENGASSIIAFLPYFGYARQHMIYRKGEAISSRIFTEILSLYSDEIITVNIHDDATRKYSSKPFNVLSAVPLIAEYFRNSKIDMVIGPDDGAMYIARGIADILGVDADHLEKKRIDSVTVSYSEVGFDVSGKNVLLADDIISTGGTIKKSINILRKMGAGNVYVGAVHGIFINNSGDDISRLCSELAVTDTMPSRYSKIKIAGIITEAMKEVA